MKRSVNPGWRAVQEGAAYLTRHAKTVASLVLSMRLSTPAGGGVAATGRRTLAYIPVPLLLKPLIPGSTV